MRDEQQRQIDRNDAKLERRRRKMKGCGAKNRLNEMSKKGAHEK